MEILVFEKWPNIAVVSVVHPSDGGDSLFTPKAAQKRRGREREEPRSQKN